MTQPGCTFVLDLWINAGSNNGDAGDGITAQQSYLTFTYQSVLVTRRNATDALVTCIPTNTVNSDVTVFESVLYNKVCNAHPLFR